MKTEFFEPFMVTDIRKLTRDYTRIMSPRTRMAEVNNKFAPDDMRGDYKMNAMIDEIKADWDAKIQVEKDLRNAGGLTEKEVKASIKRETRMGNMKSDDLKYTQYSRDSMLGLEYRGSPSDSESKKMVGSMLRTLRYATSSALLGSVWLASLPDVVRVALFTNFKTTGDQFLKSIKTTDFLNRNISPDDLIAMAQSLEKVSDVRANMWTGVEDYMPMTKIEAAGKRLQEVSMQVFGLRTHNANMKGAVAAMYGHKLSKMFIDGKLDADQLKLWGFDGMDIDGLQHNIIKYATLEGKTYNLNTNHWRDKKLIDKVMASAMWEADRIVVTPRTGQNLKFFEDSEWGATLGQFQTFNFAVVNNLMIHAGQKEASAQFAEIAGLMALGIFVHGLTNVAKGEEMFGDDDNLIAEGINRSGLGGSMAHFYNQLSSISGYDPLNLHSSKWQSRSWTDAVAGAGAGMVANALGALSADADTDQRVHYVRKMLPFQNFFGWRRGIDIVEGEAAKALGGTGKYGEIPSERGTKKTKANEGTPFASGSLF